MANNYFMLNIDDMYFQANDLPPREQAIFIKLTLFQYKYQCGYKNASHAMKVCGYTHHYKDIIERILDAMFPLTDGNDESMPMLSGGKDESLLEHREGLHWSMLVLKEIKNVELKRCASRENGKLGGRPKKPTGFPEKNLYTEAETEYNSDSKESGDFSNPPLLFENSKNEVESHPEKPNHPIWGVGLKLLVDSGQTEENARSVLGKLLKNCGSTALEEAIEETLIANPANPSAYLRKIATERSKAHGVPKNAHGGDDAENTVEAKLEDGKVVSIVNPQASKILRAKAVRYMKNSKIYSGEELRHQLFLFQNVFAKFYLPGENEMVSIDQLQVVNEAFADEELATNHWKIPQSKRAGRVA
jgi:hypothetical protein